MIIVFINERRWEICTQHEVFKFTAEQNRNRKKIRRVSIKRIVFGFNALSFWALPFWSAFKTIAWSNAINMRMNGFWDLLFFQLD